MTTLHNVERSAFRRGEYVGYGNGVWRIAKWGKAGSDIRWRAIRRDDAKSTNGRTLAAISEAIEAVATREAQND